MWCRAVIGVVDGRSFCCARRRIFFPAINIPVVSIVWQYGGLDSQQFEQRITYAHERILTVTVNNIEHIESTSYNGISVVKVFLQHGASVDAAVAQITASAQTVLRLMPPGMQPPLIIQYNAASVPISQYSFSSSKMSEQELFDVTANQVRVGLSNTRGAMIPFPYGGKQRVVAVDLNLSALKAKTSLRRMSSTPSTRRTWFCRAARRKLARWNMTWRWMRTRM